ncbi:glutathione S-transferase [Roseobacter denitrificans]|uniref:GST N-terminal domain-containing protein n=1 Tax=Roseobacter denitrificans (strain ATCC 33942 / OCh 114) TaxID=375451 RepID=Q161U8_ROSDO|nr:glutathione S-transferase [Roseobacter denitrificans]ABG33245.1 conserved hypothetical protein [Roseobacter denitrificans OCh 114]AVL52588.1 glutathione S-transferase [Roseobacter denitrificans]SFG30530.1 Glutathione S-transferase [Roseobacter denitrificans OCh 114]
MTPVFYSFRRCPYAMRARLALVSAQVPVCLREVVLKDKPQEFLEASPSGTVPCLVTDQHVIDESLDIMIWALKRNDPERLLDMPDTGWQLIETCDGPFKAALDRTKYATRYPESDPNEARAQAADYLRALEAQLSGSLFGRATLADLAILPFVRQFAFIDKAWFDTQDWPKLQDWLAQFLASDAFSRIMPKYPQWQTGDAGVAFP